MQWIIDNLPFLAAFGSAVAFLIGLFKWIDTRRREIQAKRYEQFHRSFEWLAGRTAEGKPLVDTQQAMAAYEIGTFPEYAEVSLPIIEYYLEKTTDESDDALFRKALIAAQERLSNQ